MHVAETHCVLEFDSPSDEDIISIDTEPEIGQTLLIARGATVALCSNVPSVKLVQTLEYGICSFARGSVRSAIDMSPFATNVWPHQQPKSLDQAIVESSSTNRT